MSKVNENQEEIVEEVKESTETKELAVQEEKKKFELGPKMKKGLKIAGIAGLGVLGFLLGAKWGSRKNDDSDDDYEEVEYEVVDDSSEE